MPSACRPAASQKVRLTGRQCECAAGRNWAFSSKSWGGGEKKKKRFQQPNEVLSLDGSINGQQCSALIQTGGCLTFHSFLRGDTGEFSPERLCHCSRGAGDDGADARRVEVAKIE